MMVRVLNKLVISEIQTSFNQIRNPDQVFFCLPWCLQKIQFVELPTNTNVYIVAYIWQRKYNAASCGCFKLLEASAFSFLGCWIFFQIITLWCFHISKSMMTLNALTVFLVAELSFIQEEMEKLSVLLPQNSHPL